GKSPPSAVDSDACPAGRRRPRAGRRLAGGARDRPGTRRGRARGLDPRRGPPHGRRPGQRALLVRPLEARVPRGPVHERRAAGDQGRAVRLIPPVGTPDAGARASIFERNPRKTIAALVLVAVVVTDFAFTRVYHWLSPRPAARGQTGLRVRSDVFHHGFQPLASLRDDWGGHLTDYRINSLGLRDASARQVPLRSDGRRLLFIGDSFTEGIGIAYDKTFVGL